MSYDSSHDWRWFWKSIGLALLPDTSVYMCLYQEYRGITAREAIYLSCVEIILRQKIFAVKKVERDLIFSEKYAEVEVQLYALMETGYDIYLVFSQEDWNFRKERFLQCLYESLCMNKIHYLLLSNLKSLSSHHWHRHSYLLIFQKLSPVRKKGFTFEGLEAVFPN